MHRVLDLWLAERPIVFAINAQGQRALFVPRLEVEHAQGMATVDRVDDYLEYPADPHPMAVLKRVLADLGITGRIGADSDGYPWILGYQGPSLSEVTGAEIIPIAAFVEGLMAIKSPAELALIRESAR